MVALTSFLRRGGVRPFGFPSLWRKDDAYEKTLFNAVLGK